MSEDSTDIPLQSRRVLITGATGFIGSHLARRLVHEGARVAILLRPSSDTSRIKDILSHVSSYEGDLTDASSLEQTIESAKPEIIYHLAYATSVRSNDKPIENLQTSIQVNVQGGLNLLQAAHAYKDVVKKLIRTGGLEEYGDGSIPYVETQREKPVSPYSASQVALTHYGQMFQQVTPIELITLRLALIFGPNQSEAFFIPSLIKHCLTGKPFTMTKGTQRRDYLYIDDAIDGLLCAARKPNLHGSLINIASGRAPAVKEVADIICALTHYKGALAYNKQSQRHTDIEHLVADNRYAMKRLQGQPVWGLNDGLKKTVEWYQGQPQST